MYKLNLKPLTKKLTIRELFEDLSKRNPICSRWANWQTDFGSREEEGLENKRVLEYSARRGDSRGSEIHERGEKVIKVLGVEEPLDNEQDAYFITDSRRDIETLVAIAEFLLNENQNLRAKKQPV
jgi:hypothetical protein